MVAEDPSPDNATMETLLETNEELTKAIALHQRAILHARKLRGLGNATGSGTTLPPRTDSGFAAPPRGPPPAASNAPQPAQPARKAVPIPPPGEFIPAISDDEEEPSDPFADPVNEETADRLKHVPFAGDRPPVAMGQFNDNLGVEPYHPGFKEPKKENESSAKKVTRHAGVPSDEEEEDVSVSPQSPDEARRGPSHTATSASNGSDSLYRY
jgi:formylglycine-generating enzyme required for sulfatase activity